MMSFVSYTPHHFFSVAQHPKSGLGRLIVEVSRPHTIRHTPGRTPVVE